MIKAISNLTNSTPMLSSDVKAPTSAGRTNILSRTIRLRSFLRLAAILLVLIIGVQNAWGQTYYVFYNSNVGYIVNDNGSLSVSGNSDFSPSSVWIASGNLQNSNNNLRNIRSYVDNTKYMVGNGNGSAMTLGNNSSSWRIYNGYLYHRYYYYVITANGTLYTYNSTAYERFTPTAISAPSNSSVTTVTASISGNDIISSSGNYTYTGNTGTTTVNYTLFTISGNNHYWYNDEDHDSPPAPSNQSWGTVTKTWNLSGADGYATVNSSTGVVTVTNVPLIPQTITLTLTVQDGTHSLTIKKLITLSSIPSSGSGGTVTLNDLEDHNWTYYSGVDASVDNGYYNTNYAGKMYSPNPRNVKITYKGVNGVQGSSTTVKVSINETENTFVYYKTLEQGSTSGEYPYQVISNPFSVRPSTGTGNNKVYYGFAGWKIVSGGEYIKNHNNNDVLSLDEQIVFNNLPYPSVNCTSAEIVFETTWTQANVRTGNNITTMLGNFSGGTYETNFAVLTGNYTTAWTGNKNATITSVYPDGSTDSRNGVSTRLNVTVNNGYTIKYEYININDNNTTFSMGSGTKTLYIGRGVQNSTSGGVCCNLIQGCNANINSGGLTYTLKIESGVYNYLSFTSGYDGGSETNTITGTVSMKSILGCDYDRAKRDNSKLKIQQQIMLGYTEDGTQVLRSPAAGDEVLNVTLKSGSLNSSLTSAGTADAKVSFYIGIGGEYSPGARVFTMEGGEIWSLAAGICKNTYNTNSVRFRIKGGLVKGSIYGSAANANSYGYKQMIITGGQIKGWIAGGGNGTSDNGGTTTGSSYIYVGGNARVDSEGRNVKINSSLGGQVFGSGSGVDGSTTWGEMLYGTNVVIADNAYIERNVFGGGNFGWTDQYANIYLTGQNMSVGNVYGGANQNKGEYVNIYMTGGTVREGLYGGSNTTGTISNDVKMVINGGQVGSSSTNANIHGGGYGSSTIVTGNVDITMGKSGQTTPGVTVYGDVYGGSALGSVNGTSTSTTKHTNVTLNAGTINGSLYGGALGNATTQANVYAPVAVTVNGGKVTGAVFGCNNENGTPKSSVTVTINGTDAATQGYALNEVYGGGNKASYVPGNGVTGYPKVEVTGCNNSIGVVYGGGNAADVPSTDVTIWGGTIGQVFGGGHGNKNANTAANVSGNVAVKIYGGTIGEVFAGSNSKGSINGNSCQVTIEDQGSCDMNITDVYGGGNEADGKAGTLSIGCGAVVSGNIYGGAKNAAISNDITLNITGGNLNNIFGGNNQGGNISGTITVNIEKADDCSTWHIGTVYGGGNVAEYSTPNGKSNYPQVNIKKGAISGSVYGGGLGETARVTGNPQVTVTGGAITGNIYGGGEAAPVTGNPVLTLSGNNTSAADIYGGGKGTTAVVTGNSSVTVSGGTYSNVFGGGEAANLSGSVTVNIQGGTISNDVYGGGALAHTNTANQNGNVITPKTNTTKVNLTGGTMKNVYGGGLGNSTTEAKVYGDVFVNLNKGVSSNNRGAAVTDYLFGCNNVNGTPLGSVTVYVQGTQNSGLQSMLAKNNDSYDMKAIYGGGNLAAYIPAADTSSTHVILNGCRTISAEYVYGGGNAAPVPATDVKVYGTYKVSSIFGGGNGKDALPNGDENPGADVGIYKVTEAVYNATAEHLQYKDPGNEKGDDKYILYGNIAGSSIIGTTNVMFLSGNVDHLFGGSNTKGDIIKQANVVLGDEDLETCDFNVNDVYGGSNEAYMSGSAAIDINCIEGMNEIYGGSRMADVNNDVVLTITGGTYGKVFGGNNISGRIFGSITVNIEQTGCLPIVIGELYGGGNQAPYSVYGYTGNTLNESGNKWADPTINIISCESIGKVFGGGLGAPAIVIGDPHININMVKGWTNGDYKGNGTNNDPHAEYKLTKKVSDNIGVIGTVFGGGNEAIVQGQTTINIGTEQTVTVKNVSKAVYNAIKNTVTGIANPGFAQNDGDAVTKDLTIQVEGANITGNVYGGGNNANVTGGTNIQVGKNQ